MAQTRCELCPGINNCILAECNDYTAGGIVLVGEAPGKEEDRKGHPFVGKTGEELTRHYLPLAGLRREHVYITNAIKCLPNSHGGRLSLDRPKDMELLLRCSSYHLYRELEAAKPKLIIPMGAFACFSIDPSINLELQHGIPLETSWGTVFPLWHPAGGIHEPKKMLMIRNDFVRLGKYLKGKLRLPVDECSNPKYGVIE